MADRGNVVISLTTGHEGSEQVTIAGLVAHPRRSNRGSWSAFG
jgi:hypothetical protein